MRQPESLKELIDYIKNNIEEADLHGTDAYIQLTEGDSLHELLKNLEEDHKYIKLARSME